MNNGKMATAIRDLANSVDLISEDIDPITPQYQEVRDAAELVRVLARVLEGQPIERAFGAPGDWGYGTSIGNALAGR